MNFTIPFPTRCAAVLAVAGFLALSSQAAADFEEDVQAGQPALDRVEKRPSAGQEHVPEGQPVQYGESIPTSGTHWPSWVQPGFYEERRPFEQLVHSLEHGLVVIYYDQPSEACLENLRSWTGAFQEPWSGVVAVPLRGLGRGIVLTAWERILMPTPENPCDVQAAAAFIDAFRGRGPENPVR